MITEPTRTDGRHAARAHKARRVARDLYRIDRDTIRATLAALAPNNRKRATP